MQDSVDNGNGRLGSRGELLRLKGVVVHKVGSDRLLIMSGENLYDAPRSSLLSGSIQRIVWGTPVLFTVEDKEKKGVSWRWESTKGGECVLETIRASKLETLIYKNDKSQRLTGVVDNKNPEDSLVSICVKVVLLQLSIKRTRLYL